MKMIRMAVLVAAASAAASKAKEYARENPEKASQTIGKVESFIGAKAGPKYADKVGKGSDALRTSLGLPGATAGHAGPTTPPTPAGSVTPTTPAAPPGSVGTSPSTTTFDPSI